MNFDNFFNAAATVSGGLFLAFAAFIVFAASLKWGPTSRLSVLAMIPAVVSLAAAGFFLRALDISLVELAPDSVQKEFAWDFFLPSLIPGMLGFIYAAAAWWNENAIYNRERREGRRTTYGPLLGFVMVSIMALDLYQMISTQAAIATKSGAAEAVVAVLSLGCTLTVVLALITFAFRGKVDTR